MNRPKHYKYILQCEAQSRRACYLFCYRTPCVPTSRRVVCMGEGEGRLRITKVRYFILLIGRGKKYRTRLVIPSPACQVHRRPTHLEPRLEHSNDHPGTKPPILPSAFTSPVSVFKTAYSNLRLVLHIPGLWVCFFFCKNND